MTIEVFGSYKSKDEAIKEVDRLSLEGIPANHIRVFTLQESAEELAKETDGKVKNVNEDYDDDFISKVKKMFFKVSDTDNNNLHDELVEHGLSSEQATRYTAEIRDGKILVLADNKVKMGHHPMVGEDELKVPFIDRKNY